jgi:hypothetical protein
MFFSRTNNTGGLLSLKTTLILIVFLLILFAFLGINVLKNIRLFSHFLYDLFTPIIYQIMSILGYSTGTIINKTSHIVSNTTKNGIDIIDHSVSDIGNILKYAGKDGAGIPVKTTVDNANIIIPTPALMYKETFSGSSPEKKENQENNSIQLLNDADNDIKQVIKNLQQEKRIVNSSKSSSMTAIPIGSIVNVGSSIPASISGSSLIDAVNGSSFITNSSTSPIINEMRGSNSLPLGSIVNVGSSNITTSYGSAN